MMTPRGEFPLRGYLECRKCGKNISGSASKGNGGKYYHYHCTRGCVECFKSEIANEAFIRELLALKISPATAELNYEILRDDFKTRNKQALLEVRKLDGELVKNKTRIESAHLMAIGGELDFLDFKAEN
jgi:site-specific DNA recombinase